MPNCQSKNCDMKQLIWYNVWSNSKLFLGKLYFSKELGKRKFTEQRYKCNLLLRLLQVLIIILPGVLCIFLQLIIVNEANAFVFFLLHLCYFFCRISCLLLHLCYFVIWVTKMRETIRGNVCPLLVDSKMISHVPVQKGSAFLSCFDGPKQSFKLYQRPPKIW